MSILSPANCTDAPSATPSDAGVAGAGVSSNLQHPFSLAKYLPLSCQILLSFMITACLAIILSASVIFAEFRGKQSMIRRKLLNSYSDSQIFQGIGIQCKNSPRWPRFPWKLC
jgi:hypothetical protein